MRHQDITNIGGGSGESDNVPTPYIFSLSDIGATNFNDDIPTLLAAHIATLDIDVTDIQNMSFEVNDTLPSSTLFYLSNVISDPCQVAELCIFPAYHNGDSALPEIGDSIFEDSELTILWSDSAAYKMGITNLGLGAYSAVGILINNGISISYLCL